MLNKAIDGEPVYVCMYVCVCMYVGRYVCMYVCVCVCVCMYVCIKNSNYERFPFLPFFLTITCEYRLDFL
jgi:hypothetical protein